MKAEYLESKGCLQRDSAERKEYAGAQSIDSRKAEEADGADLLEKVLNRDNLNRAYKHVKANKGAPGIDGMTVEDALGWLRDHKEELLESIRNGKYKPQPVRRKETLKELKLYTSGWLNYYSIAEMRNRMQKLNEWLRRRIRMYIWKQWKKISAKFRNLQTCGSPRSNRLGSGQIPGWVTGELPEVLFFHAL